MDRDSLKEEERFNKLLASAESSGFRVDGVPIAKAFLDETSLDRLESLVFNDKALAYFKKKASRIEFIADGVLPSDLLDEPPLKSEPIFRQVIGYDICKGCRLCIEVCPKHVYKDDGFGRPDRENHREEECTGPHQCGQCVDVCPEDTIELALADAVFKSTVFVLMPNPNEQLLGSVRGNDFIVANPLQTKREFKLEKKLNEKDLEECHRVLDQSQFHPLVEIKGYTNHFVNSRNPEEDLKLWAKENGRDSGLVLDAVRLLYKRLPRLKGLKAGKYRLSDILNRIVDEIIHPGIEIEKSGGLDLLSEIVREAHLEEPFLGAKTRPIGGLLPPSTSTAWKTPYGEEIPDYVHMEKCLGPECGLCVTHCPEGGGGENSALQMVLKVPQGVVPSLVRGLDVHLIKLDGSHNRYKDLKNLSGQSPFVFEVDPDYCKACGLCITCCPHDVIEPSIRTFDLRKVI